MAKDTRKGHTGGGKKTSGYHKGEKWNPGQGQAPQMRGKGFDKPSKQPGGSFSPSRSGTGGYKDTAATTKKDAFWGG